MRVSKPDAATVGLSFFRRRGRSLTVSATATAGLSATVRGRELLALLMRAISPNPEADLIALVNAGLDDKTIEAMQQAIAASVDRSLTLTAQLQASALRDDQALFAYQIALSRLDQPGKDALTDALHGRLTAIELAAAVNGGPIRLVASAERQLRERKTTWRLNLLGILNVASFVDLIREGTLTFDPVSGALNAADRISSKRIRVTSTPLASNPEKLRRVLFESLLVTAAYQASRILGRASLTLTADHTYVEQRSRTRRADLEGNYRVLIALGLCDAQERDARLGTDTEFGSSIFVVGNHFDASACDAMFLDGAGAPHDAAHFERIARHALLALLPPTDPLRSFRRFALESDATWDRVRNVGSDLFAALPTHIAHDPGRLNVVRADVITIKWWATAMSRAARELVAVRKVLGNTDAAALADDATFRKARTKFADALESVVATTEPHFDEPWDVLAMDAAAARQGTLDSMIVSTRFAAAYADTHAAVEAPVAPARRRATRDVPIARTATAEPRDWTADELDLFGRHVVNLRGGHLSGDGTFASTPEQVTRIFTEQIPAYARRLGSGRRPRVLFFAHGGLVDEREGLLPVLFRRRFWEMNGVYPVYFVWETGLRETLRDIIGAVAPARAGLGPATDAAIERLARNGGKQVWGQMKKSAEEASATAGGARLVAQLAAALWKSLGGAIEFHALGHSAGSILHAFFLPVLIGQKITGAPAVSVQSVHFLAPALTTDLFKSQLVSLVGSGRPINRLVEYTMTDELEQADSSLRPYGKSLLYLVTNAFEDAVPTPLAGLQANLTRDLPLIRFFGLGGREKVADIVFSPSGDTSPLTARSRSNKHGGFDNDVPTMTSVIRRILDVPDTEPVTDYFEDPIPGFERAAVGMVPPAAPDSRTARPVVSRAPAIVASSTRKPWTVMVWMAGDNNFESLGNQDLAEMKRVGSTDDVNVLVQFDRMKDGRTRRYKVTRGDGADGDIVQELGETSTGDAEVAIDFFRWGIERYPASRLLGVIWNHGARIDDSDVDRQAGSTAIGGNGNGRGDEGTLRRALPGRHRPALFGTTSAQATNGRATVFDDTSRDFLDNLELKRVLAEVTRQTGRTLDVLGLDACLMNMIEVAYQMRGTAQVMVGSEELEPGSGWPYDGVLDLITTRPTITAPELGQNIVRLYIDSYKSAGITQSALDLGELDSVATAVDRLAKALTRAIAAPAEYTAVARTLNATQRFDTADFVDLGHFCQELRKRTKSAAVKAAAKATLDALAVRDGFILAESHKGASVKHSSGAAIYCPRGPVNKAYAKLDFARATGWRSFLESFHKA
jgi:hypothetical protein